MRPTIDPVESFVTGEAVVVRRDEAQLRATIALLEQENAQLRRTVRELEQAVDRDALTALYNRRFFDQALIRACALARRHAVPAAVVYIDVDDLKRINDDHGHAAGDAVLREVAARLSATTRASDICARIGGDEFAMILNIATEEQARRQIDRLIAVLARQPVRHGATDIVLSASFGLAMLEPDQDCAAVLDEADRDMYRNKPAAD